jgi:uncharacterized membrane protein YraQ (UPF0718 family)
VYAVPVAALAGAALPGCECGSVPIARRLMSRGVTPAAALTFLLSAPAINPVVLVATAVAFPGQPEMVAARFVASLIAAVAVGLAWTMIGRGDLLALATRPAPPSRRRPIEVFMQTAQHDFLSAGGYLVIGAAAAASLQTAVPRSVVDVFAQSPIFSVLALAVLAVVLALCSEADAFVAAGLKQFSLTARLAFLVVGPMVDVKLIALQAGTFGRAFTVRFAPLTFVCALGSASLVGWWMPASMSPSSGSRCRAPSSARASRSGSSIRCAAGSCRRTTSRRSTGGRTTRRRRRRCSAAPTSGTRPGRSSDRTTRSGRA